MLVGRRGFVENDHGRHYYKSISMKNIQTCSLFKSGFHLMLLLSSISFLSIVTQLTSVSLKDILYSSIQCRAASLLNPADYYCSCSALSDWSLIQEL